MFGKLMKHELQFYAKSFLPILAAFMLIGIVLIPIQFIEIDFSNLHLIDNPYVDEYFIETLNEVTTASLYGFLSITAFLIIGAFSLAVTILYVIRFYRYFYTSQGYLSFTLPVKTSTHISVKSIAALLTIMISSIATLVFLVLTLLLKPLTTPEFNEILHIIIESLPSLFECMSTFDIINVGLLIIQGFFNVCIGAVFAIGWYYMCISLGQVIWHKHRIIAAVGVYMVGDIIKTIISYILSYAMQLCLITPFITSWYAENVLWVNNATFFITNAVNLILTFVVFFVTWYCMKHRLNI